MRLACIITLLLGALVLNGCSYQPEVQLSPLETESVPARQPPISVPTGGPQIAEPLLISSIGQSTDAHMVGALCRRAGIDYVLHMTLTPSQLSPHSGALILVVGGGSLGLAHSRATVDTEIARARGLTTYARALNIPVIIMHIGGELRRGLTSDRLASQVVAWSDYVIVVNDGNRDGFFTRLSDASNIPLETVDSIVASIEPLRRLIQ